ncbi:hypothetical protein E1264_08630 [Actinomadura sp. KC216]|uniref:hypothetical protein n=1 Tax=Actinomadura sp. KC216 TaxID=2530370 RepID=UPI00104675EB|nr:hypothetical protein [Actinomadura sp. KC216]TDB89313.1 hypothetical protein E1264_08630 [Actinomadura sp. KC216]
MSDEAAEVPAVPVAGHAVEPPPAPEEPEFPAVPPPDPTGDPRVDAAVARLGELGARPVPEHVEIYEDVHQRLQELLASADQDEPQPAQVPQPARPAFPDVLRPRP